MKSGIHPTYQDSVKIQCACGAAFAIGSTKESYKVDICSKCHPFYTGKQKMIDTAGRVDKFRARQKAAEEKKVAMMQRMEKKLKEEKESLEQKITRKAKKKAEEKEAEKAEKKPAAKKKAAPKKKTAKKTEKAKKKED